MIIKNIFVQIFVKETTESCPEIDPIEATRFKLKQVTIPHQCCKKNVREACIYEDMVYDIGEKWMLKNDSCVTEMCANGPDGVTVQQETKFCDTMCRKVCGPVLIIFGPVIETFIFE